MRKMVLSSWSLKTLEAILKSLILDIIMIALYTTLLRINSTLDMPIITNSLFQRLLRSTLELIKRIKEIINQILRNSIQMNQLLMAMITHLLILCYLGYMKVIYLRIFLRIQKKRNLLTSPLALGVFI